MRFDFSSLPNEASKRPFVSVQFARLPGLLIPALVDSGATANRFDAEFAELMNIDYSNVPPELIAIGGSRRLCYSIDVQLEVGRWSWTAPVGFVPEWHHSHGILGLYGFFDNFSVRIEGASSYGTLTRRPRAILRSL